MDGRGICWRKIVCKNSEKETGTRNRIGTGCWVKIGDGVELK